MRGAFSITLYECIDEQLAGREQLESQKLSTEPARRDEWRGQAPRKSAAARYLMTAGSSVPLSFIAATGQAPGSHEHCIKTSHRVVRGTVGHGLDG